MAKKPAFDSKKTPAVGKPRLKLYLEDLPGVPLTNVWIDISREVWLHPVVLRIAPV